MIPIARVELPCSHDPLQRKPAGDGPHIESPQSWASEHALDYRILIG